MDEFYQLWPLMGDHQQNTDIYLELLSILNKKKSMMLSTMEYLKIRLTKDIYPTYQVLRVLPYELYINVCWQTVQHLSEIRNNPEHHNLLSLLSLMLHSRWSNELQNNVDQVTLSIRDKFVAEIELTDEIWICLMSTPKDFRILRTFTDLLKSSKPQYKIEDIYMKSITKKRHFLDHEICLNFGITNAQQKVIMALARFCCLVPIDQHLFEGFNLNFIKNCLTFAVYLEQKRIYTLQKHIPTVDIGDLVPTFNVIDTLCQHVTLNMLDYNLVKIILEENQLLNNQISQNVDESKCNSSEMDLYEQFTVITKMSDYICGSNIHEQSKLNILKNSLWKIQNIDRFLDTVKACLALIFFRWDCISPINLDRTIESGSESENRVESEVEEKLGKVRTHEKVGFMCNVDNLTNILKIIRTTMTKKRYSEEFSFNSNTSFEQIVDVIADASWRITLFKSLYKGGDTFTEIDTKTYLKEHIAYLNQRTIDESSDDEYEELEPVLPDVVGNVHKGSKSQKLERHNSFPRRKPRKKQPFEKTDGKRHLSFSHSTENERKVSKLDNLYQMRHQNQGAVSDSSKCILSKMLGDMEHLVTVCMNNGDVKSAHQIIKTNSMENSNLAGELLFTESFQLTKDKLCDILDRLRIQEELHNQKTYSLKTNMSSPTDTPQLTVNRIKKVAAVGFEASKITNMIARFSTENQLPLVNEHDIRSLLHKFSENHKFLRYYRPTETLQATILCEFVISLAHSHEIANNIFTVLTKLWDITDISNPPPLMGYLGFLCNLIETMRQHSNVHAETKSAQSILADDFLSNNPRIHLESIKREQLFRQIYLDGQTDFENIENITTMQCTFESLSCNRNNTKHFNRVFHYVTSVHKLNQHFDSAKPTNTSTDMLRIDQTAFLGSLIFVNNIAPQQIERLARSININLVHVIAINVCPAIECNHFDDISVIEKSLSGFDNAISQARLSTETEFNSQRMYSIKPVVSYLAKYNQFLTFLLLNLCNGFVPELEDQSDTPTEAYPFLLNLVKLPQIQMISRSYANNIWMAALSFDGTNVGSVTAFLMKTFDLKHALYILHAIKCSHHHKNRRPLKLLQDWLIHRILSSTRTHFKLIDHISDITAKTKCLLHHLPTINNSKLAIRLIRSILLHKNHLRVNPISRDQLREWLLNITVYTEISNKFTLKRLCQNSTVTWLDIKQMSVDKPEMIFELLLESADYRLALQWVNIHPIGIHLEKMAAIASQCRNTVNRLVAANTQLFSLIETLPHQWIDSIYLDLLLSVRCVAVLRYLVDFLQLRGSNRNLVHIINVSLTTFEIFDNASDLPWHLLRTPLLIFEELLMNSQFDTLHKIIGGTGVALGDAQCVYCSKNRSRLVNEFVDNQHEFSQMHSVSVDCVDSLLRVYASKALDFRVIESHISSDDLLSHVTDPTMTSLDSLLGTFIMPKEAPARANWIRDEEATHCMCCRRSVFTMLTRRHHCRQCGRVVCHACSTHRSLIAALYADVAVRICDDCHRQIELDQRKQSANSTPSNTTTGGSLTPRKLPRTSSESNVWRFSGHQHHDDLLREEFCYEFAPSVSLCLSILTLHSNRGTECSNFLLLHCDRFESLLRPLQPGYPNPEIDYSLVTRMLHCLALAAKVRGGPPQCDVVLMHAEIIRSIVQHRCESLLPMEPLNRSSFRQLRDALVLDEKWTLALEVSLKFGFTTTGVMAAWAIACLKSGCFLTAREKFNHCLSKLGNDDDIYKMLSLIVSEGSFNHATTAYNTPCIKRPSKSPPLVAEIVQILEQTFHPAQPEVIARANIIIDSNCSLASSAQRSLKDSLPYNEPALNILHTLSNLKHVLAGSQEVLVNETNLNASNTTLSMRNPFVKHHNSPCAKRLSPESRFYDECLFYLTAYGSHNDILAFFVKHGQIRTALKYIYYQKVEHEHFVRTLFVPHLRKGRATILVKQMLELDETLLSWKSYIIALCAFLERTGQLNCLYLIQILFKDPVRASMTCVRFYETNCSSYSDLLGQTFHLINAEKHMTKELDLCQWSDIRPNQGTKVQRKADNNKTQRSLLMKIDSKALNNHINTIGRQLEVTKFLANCEHAGRPTVKLLPKMFMQSTALPILFGSTIDKVEVAVLILICGTNVTEGFGLAFRIIHDFTLEAESVYAVAAKYFAENQKLSSVERLIECIRENDEGTRPIAGFCDRIIAIAVDAFCSEVGSKLTVDAASRELFDRLVKQVVDVGIRINCHISGGQLKSAYLLAIQHAREADIRKVLRHAEQTNQHYIRKLCERKLNIIH